MKAKVISPFRDKNHPECVYSTDDVFEGEEERIAELEHGGYVVRIVEKPKKTKATKKK